MPAEQQVDPNIKSPAHFASRYFELLTRDPSECELGGFLQDIVTDELWLPAAADVNERVYAFGEALQQQLAGLARQVNGVGVTLHISSYDDARVRLDEINGLAGTLTMVDADPLNNDVLHSVAMLLERLTGEAIEALNETHEDRARREERGPR